MTGRGVGLGQRRWHGPKTASYLPQGWSSKLCSPETFIPKNWSFPYHTAGPTLKIYLLFFSLDTSVETPKKSFKLMCELFIIKSSEYAPALTPVFCSSKIRMKCDQIKTDQIFYFQAFDHQSVAFDENKKIEKECGYNICNMLLMNH